MDSDIKVTKKIVYEFSKKDKLSRFFYCSSCLKRCERCGEMKDPYNFKVSKKTNAQICEECFRKEMKEGVLKDVFR